MGRDRLIGRRIYIEELERFGKVAKVTSDGRISHAYVSTTKGEKLITVIGLTIRLITLAEILIDHLIRLWKKWFK
jgi:hypothetical protein